MTLLRRFLKLSHWCSPSTTYIYIVLYIQPTFFLADFFRPSIEALAVNGKVSPTANPSDGNLQLGATSTAASGEPVKASCRAKYAAHGTQTMQMSGVGSATSHRSNIEHEWSTQWQLSLQEKCVKGDASVLRSCAWLCRKCPFYLSKRLQPGMWIPARHCKVTIQLPLAKSK